MQMTFRDRYIRYLLAKGFTPVKSRSKKYLVYYRIVDNSNRTEAMFYHLAANGTLRWSSDGKVGHSYACNHVLPKMVSWEIVSRLSV